MSDVRAMMKRGRKGGVDMKALKQAKAKKLQQLAEEKAKKERAEERKQRALMPPPPPKSMMPPPKPLKKKSLPAGFFDNESESASSEEPAPAAPSSNLPAGFFDAGSEPETASEDQSAAGGLGGLVSYGSDDEEEEEEEQNIDEPQEEAVPHTDEADGDEQTHSSSLPAGFFDNEEADLRARGIEPEVQKQQDEEADMKEFFEFAREVAQTEEDVAKEVEAEEEEKEEVANVEQMLYLNRLAVILHKSEAKDKSTEQPVALEKDETATLDLTEMPDSAVTEVSKLVKTKSKKKKRKLKDLSMPLEDDGYVPLDPLDWRSKGM